MTGVANPAPYSFKVVEIPKVFDDEIEAELNRWTAEGYRFESIHFVTQPGNRRPTMAFLFFSRATAEEGG